MIEAMHDYRFGCLRLVGIGSTMGKGMTSKLVFVSAECRRRCLHMWTQHVCVQNTQQT